MQAYITSAYPDPQPIGRFLELLGSRGRGYVLATDPELADLVLFVENSQYESDPEYRALRAHPLVRFFPEKCFMYNEQINPWCVLPGLYPNVLRRYYDPTRMRASCYVRDMNPYVPNASWAEEPRLLFSFMGNHSGRIRRLVFSLQHGASLVQDTSSFNAFHGSGTEVYVAQQRRYAAVMVDSKFVLCPRGAGTSSFRLYEAMRCGRCPVVISDQWVEPGGTDLGFLVRVREADIDRVPRILESIEDQWLDRGRLARAAWETWFAPEARAAHMLDTCWAIRQQRCWPEGLRRKLPSIARVERIVRGKLLAPLVQTIIRRRS